MTRNSQCPLHVSLTLLLTALFSCGGAPFQDGADSLLTDGSPSDSMTDSHQTYTVHPNTDALSDGGTSGDDSAESTAEGPSDANGASIVDAKIVIPPTDSGGKCCATFGDPNNVQCTDRSGPPYGAPLPCDGINATCGDSGGCMALGPIFMTMPCAGRVVDCQ